MKSPFTAIWARLCALGVLALGTLLPAWSSLNAAFGADEYQPVNQAARAPTDPNPFILIAYGATWLVILVYVIIIARGFARAEAEVAELKRRVAGGGAPPRA